MSDSFSVHLVFETAPTELALAGAVARWREADLLYAGGDVDPATQDDAAIAAALLEDAALANTLAVGAGDVGGSVWLNSTGLSTTDPDDHFEGARDLPHATLRVTDGHFYPMADEHGDGDPEAAVRERARDLLALVADLYEGFAAAGARPTHVYAPHPGTEQLLWDPGSPLGFDAADALATVPPEVFLLQVYAPDAVAAIGRECVLAAPAPHVRELDDGSVLVAAYETPTLYTDGPHAIGPVADHLGVDATDRG